ncbi:MAG: HIRAN domain-containing protein [Clostridiales Family XIII bacterium]|jgi:triacylglycerol esterase/lipase EstA (alpha/beta hydrolase family)|nr:HIRAN domain-containing protein [Clostridiales Family XIII bacterium]
MKRNTEKHSKVMIIANSLVKQGTGRSAAMIKAWTFVKSAPFDMKVASVTHGKRQKALEHLERYPARMITVTLRREGGNAYDKNAVTVAVSVEGKGSYVVGYAPRMLAAFLAPLADVSKPVQAAYKTVTGGFDPLAHRGLLISVAV